MSKIDSSGPNVNLPRFSRKMWVSEEARRVWAPRFADFAQRWRQIEWLTVVHGVRPCALVSVTRPEMVPMATSLASHGLRVTPVAVRMRSTGDGKQEVFHAVVGDSRHAAEFKSAWDAGNDEATGRLLGYPSCCCEFYHQVVSESGSTDCVLRIGCGGRRENIPTVRDANGPPEVNPFLRSVGLQLIPHLPCDFNCQGSLSLARNFIAAARAAQYGDAVDAALQALSWPLEWTALHGISETRTPILKISQRAERTHVKHTIHRSSPVYPIEGAPALRTLLGAPIG
jgi:hypothetical protein